MLNKLLPIALILVFIVSAGWMVSKKDQSQEIKLSEDRALATIHKDPYCSCCGKWGEYMESKGYETNTVLEDDMTKIKEQFNVPYELESCHTAEIEGYVIEGHIPNEAIEKLLKERPDVKGIGMAGMPSGSPGMPGPKADFLIYEINHDGTKGDLFIKL